MFETLPNVAEYKLTDLLSSAGATIGIIIAGTIFLQFLSGSLLAVQVLLTQGAWALLVLGQQPGAVSSPRGVLREIRREIEACLGERQRRRFLQRLAQAQRERRLRRSSKVKQAWPSRADHKPPKPPKIRKMSDEIKVLVNKSLMAA